MIIVYDLFAYMEIVEIYISIHPAREGEREREGAREREREGGKEIGREREAGMTEANLRLMHATSLCSHWDAIQDRGWVKMHEDSSV